MKKLKAGLFKYILLVGLFTLISNLSFSQLSICDAGVPYFLVDLTSDADGIWVSPNISRNEQCCGAPNSDKCISFEVLLDTGAVGIQIDMIGADPAGSLYYSINCVGSYPGGTVKCITGAGPHLITFCKPGNNKNIYTITSVSKPNFPDDQHVRIGCSKLLETLGIVDTSTHWQSVYPGAPGDYNSYLSCTHCASPVYTPAATAPPYVDYYVCGYPIASLCGYNTTVCDTVRIYNDPELVGTISPNPATFCNVGPGSGVLLSAAGSGGLPPYNYIWRNSLNAIVGTGTTYFASAAGNYTLEIGDSLNSSTCPSYYTTVTVSIGQIPVVNAGANQVVCATNPTVNLSGTVQYVSGGIWTGGSGVFNPGNTFLNTLYIPSSAELLAGFVTLTLTSTGTSGGCTNSSDQITITFSDSVKVIIPTATLNCNNNSTTINTNVTGGIAPFTYQWNTGATSSSIVASQGNYVVQVTDSIGCTGIQTYNLNAPSALAISFTSTDATTNGGSDGQATVVVTGGTMPYAYLWSPGGQTTGTITGLPYGIYTVIVTDANGCVISGSVVINEPRCLGFNVTATSTDVSCYGSTNGTGSAIATGGTIPYTYSWNSSPVQTTANASFLEAGVYTISVSDSNSCLQTANIVITEPTVLTNVMNHTNPSSISGINGTATANPFGGAAPYTYSWNTGGSMATINGLAAGVYVVTITDFNGCSIVDSVQLLDPDCNKIALSVISSNVACFGGNTGSAIAVVTNATPPTVISWSNGQVGPLAAGLSAGNYSVTISDGNNCSVFSTFTITQPSLLGIGASTNPISCNGIQDATVDLSISGGVYPYAFSWSNGATSEDLINLGPGGYTATIHDYNGCVASLSVSFVEPTAISTSYSIQKPTCIFGSNGSINLTVSGGTVPYAYDWSNAANTQDIFGLQAGGYSVAVLDANGCATESPLIISILETDSVVIASHSVACSIPVSGVALVAVVPAGGNPGTYQISFNNGTSYQALGDYDALLPNDSTYSIMVKDITGCTSLNAYQIVVKPQVKITAVSFINCFAIGTLTTPVTVSVSGGDGGAYSISYNGGTTYQTAGTYVFNLAVGLSYTIVAKDSSGCISEIYSITIPSVLIVDANATSNYFGVNVSCFGATDGAAIASVSGGAIPYSYSWSTSPVQTSSSATNIVAGTYTVTVSDVNGCTRTDTVTLTQPTLLTATALVTSNYNGQNISCFGASNGTASVTPTGGTTPYSYSWSTIPSQLTANASGLGATTYTATTNDANGCTASATVTLTQPTAMSSTAAVVSNYNGQNISCNGANNGSAAATVSGGTLPYTFSWSTSPVQTNDTAFALGASTYTVSISDVNSCSSSAIVTLTQPTLLTATALVTSNYNGQNISCFGASNGTASVTPTGGTTPYSYSWSTIPSQLTANASGLGATTYTATTNDANGCTASATVTLTQPTAMSSTAAVVSNYNGQNISCNGANNGSAATTVSGGTLPYTFSWSTSPVQTNDTAFALGASTYTVSISDVNSCSSSAIVTLTQPTLLTATALVTSNYNGQNISCFGASNGTASVTPTGGTTPYSYSWSTIPSQLTANASGLGATTYTATTNDANGCTASATVTLTQPTAMSSTAAVVSNYNGQNISCNGANNGSAAATVSGGTLPYTFSWSTSPVQTNDTAFALGASTYTVSISDVNSCSSSAIVTLTQPAALISSATAISLFGDYNVRCYGSVDGSIDLTVNGGTSPYSFPWSNGASSEDLVGIGAGVYSVSVMDVNGCTDSASVIITQPNPLNADINSISNYNGYAISCYGNSNGSIDAGITGGMLPYNYSWSNGALTQDQSLLTAGTYILTVTDFNGCTDLVTAILTQPAKLIVSIDSISNYNGYGVSCYSASNGSIFTTVSGGITPYNYTWNNGAITDDITGLSATGYILNVEDFNGCFANADTTLIQPAAFLSNYTFANPGCNGMANGSIDFTLMGGVLPYSYYWNNGSLTQDLINVPAGTYNLIFADINGCVDSTSINLSEPFELENNINEQNVLCYSENNGSIDINIAGGTLPYTFLWSNGSTQEDIDSLTWGMYYVTITDALGCKRIDTVEVSQPDSLFLSLDSPELSNGFNISFYQGADGSINLTVNGGVLPYTYTWATNQNTEDLEYLPAGQYSVVVTDENGCAVSGSIKLTEPYELAMPTGITPNSDGSNDFFVVKGIEAYPDNVLTIYNRWGNIVYKKENYFNSWLGTNTSGEELPEATYFAILEINGGAIVLNGYVEIRRK